MAFRFEQLDIWVEANKYAALIYKLTKRFPRDEIFALTAQLSEPRVQFQQILRKGPVVVAQKTFATI